MDIVLYSSYFLFPKISGGRTMKYMIVCMLLLIGGCVSQGSYDMLANELEQEQDLRAQMQSDLETLQATTTELQDDLNQVQAGADIKSDYIELYQYLVAAAVLEGSLDHQYWQIYNDPDGIYTSIYTDELNQYKAQVATTKDKINRLISKLEAVDNVEGLPEELDTVSELEDLRAGLDLAVDTYEAEVADFN